MKLKRFVCLLFTCITVMSCLIAPTNAADVPNNVIQLEDMACGSIDLSDILSLEEAASARSTGSINVDIASGAIRCTDRPISFVVGSTITFQCSFSPSSASLDFGVITPEGRFYYINVKGGSIDQSIRISQAGSYSVAIRNNSSQTVSVVGFVNY